MTQPTIDEIRDQVAEWEGWTRTLSKHTDTGSVPMGSQWHRPTGSGTPGSITWCVHPVRFTLDEAAKFGDRYPIRETEITCEDGVSTAHASVFSVALRCEFGVTATSNDSTDAVKQAWFRAIHAAMKAERGIA